MRTPSLGQNLSLDRPSSDPQQSPGRLGDLALAPKAPVSAQERPPPLPIGVLSRLQDPQPTLLCTPSPSSRSHSCRQRGVCFPSPGWQLYPGLLARLSAPGASTGGTHWSRSRVQGPFWGSA